MASVFHEISSATTDISNIVFPFLLFVVAVVDKERKLVLDNANVSLSAGTDSLPASLPAQDRIVHHAPAREKLTVME